MKKINHISLAILTLSTIVVSQPAAAVMAVNGDASPWTFWYWMYGAVSREGIHADLCGMKDIGLGGCYLMPIRSSKERPEYGGKADQLTPEFWSMVDYAMQQADSLGLGMGVHICDGFALAGYPTITPAESMQKVVWSDTIVSGGRIRGLQLRQPESYNGYYEDIATYAIRCTDEPRAWRPDSIVLSDNVSTKKGYWLASSPATITYCYNQPVTVRSMYVEPEGNNVQSERLLVEASADGRNYYKVRKLVPPRQGWQNTSCGYTFSLPETTARYFRFSWTPKGTEPGSEDLDAAKWKALLKLRNVILSNESRIDNYEGKAGYVWRIATSDTIEDAAHNASATEYIQPEDIIRLTLTDGTVTTRLPKGRWRIMRIGHTSTGQMNATAGGGKGLEVDKFSRQATMKLLDGWFMKFLERKHSSAVKYLHVDSWECGSQNWGAGFADEFRKRRGYDLLPYLPVMCGVPVESEERTEQVLKDVRLTINDLVNDVFFKTVSDVGYAHGMLVSHESIAPTFPADGIEHYKYSDIPMGEFWLNSPTHDKPCDMLDAVSGAHAYGKNIVQAEGFTEVRGTWDETPAMIKTLLDRNFSLGMNKLFFHVNVHNPWTDRKPGMTLDGIGLFFQRDNTWYREASGLVDYITRCQEELQKGTPVVDIAVFTGEDIPSRSMTPDRLVPMLPGLFGKSREGTERIRRGNEGEPMTESPVGVVHSANIIDLKDWTNALHGYKYDCINRDALLNADIHDLKFKVLVLPQYFANGVKARPLSDAVRKRIEELRRNGVVVIGTPYHEADFTAFGLQPDILLPDSMDYYHRHTDRGELYFITNQQEAERHVTVSFRGVYRFASYMNPVTGRRQEVECRQSGDRTVVPLPFCANGSVIVRLADTPDAEAEAIVPKTVTEKGINAVWNIHFDGLNTDIRNVSDYHALDWSKSSDNRISHYSGHAVYTTNINVKDRFDGCVLRLGDVRDVAHVYVNGKDCGIAWTAPYEVDITKALRHGKNELKIVVVNTWHNAILGADSGQPPFDGIWTNAKYRTKSKALLPAGLVSPLKLKYWINKR